MIKFPLFFASLLFICAPLYAQVSFGLAAGYKFSAMEFKDPGGRSSNGLGSSSQLKAVYGDLIINIPLYDRWHLQPVFRYITKGTRLVPGEIRPDDYVESANKLRLHYLEVPVILVYKIPLAPGKLVLGAGPYGAWGLGGKSNLEVYHNGQVVERNTLSVSFSGKDKGINPGTRLNRRDLGINVMMGMEFNNLLMLGLTYSQGLQNLDRSGNSTIKNTYFGISAGIMLSREDY